MVGRLAVAAAAASLPERDGDVQVCGWEGRGGAWGRGVGPRRDGRVAEGPGALLAVAERGGSAG